MTLGRLPDLVAEGGVEVERCFASAGAANPSSLHRRSCSRTISSATTALSPIPGSPRSSTSPRDAYRFETHERKARASRGNIAQARTRGRREVPEGQFHWLWLVTAPLRDAWCAEPWRSAWSSRPGLSGRVPTSTTFHFPRTPRRTRRSTSWIAFDDQAGLEGSRAVESVQAGVRLGASTKGA